MSPPPVESEERDESDLDTSTEAKLRKEFCLLLSVKPCNDYINNYVKADKPWVTETPVYAADPSDDGSQFLESPAAFESSEKVRNKKNVTHFTAPHRAADRLQHDTGFLNLLRIKIKYKAFLRN